MATLIEYALMAGRAYQTTRNPINQFPIPNDWLELAHVPNNPAYPQFTGAEGFEAVAFKNGTEIVISFAGTAGDGDWWHGNIPLALGALPDQLRQAADYYLKIKNDPANVGATITFTGHSLGGGLASLMAVLFGENATTFDQAPFRNAALTFTRSNPDTGDTTHATAEYLLAYLTGETRDGQPVYSAMQLQGLTDFITASTNAAPGVVPNESNVTDINVYGEILGYLPQSRIGSQADLWQQNNMSIPVDTQIKLHSQALLTAFLQSGDQPTATEPTGTPRPHTLGQASYQLTDLLKMIFDPDLFAHPVRTTNTTDQNFLEHIVRHQTGGVDGVPTGGDAMVTRFTSDLWKLAQDGGLTMKDGNTGNPDLHQVNNALIAFAMQKYYEEKEGSVGEKQELFSFITGETGSLRFDMAAVSKKFQDAFAANKALDLSDAKGYKYFKDYLEQTATSSTEELGLINGLLPWLRDWYVQAGSDGMTATDTLNRGAFLLGGKGADVLTGGSSADLLMGNRGADRLRGGKGNDLLLGGEGNDVYEYTSGSGSTGDGLDTVFDSDGLGRIEIDGSTRSGGAQYGDNRVYRDADKHLYVKVDDKTLVIDGNIIVKNYTVGETALGLNMTGAPAETANPVTTLTITGDITPADIDSEHSGIQAPTKAAANASRFNLLRRAA